MTSRYDRIYDSLWSDDPAKRGSKYERLCAIVAAHLDAASSVKHDVKLVGDISGAEHQIDVHVTKDNVKRRTIIECKDFDVAGDPVGLGIVRDFYGVIADVMPDEAWIITCNRFTAPARKYAKGFGIKLATIRDFREEDWNGRVKRIVITMQIKQPTDHQVTFDVSAEHQGSLQAALAHQVDSNGRTGIAAWHEPTFLLFPNGEKTDIFDWLNGLQAHWDILTKVDGTYQEPVSLPGVAVQLSGFRAVPINGITVSYRVVSHSKEVIVDSSDKVATLLINGFGDHDGVVWDETLIAYRVNEATGDIVSIE